MSEVKTMSHRKIGGISLINTGLKGVIITYETVEIIDGVSYNSEDNKKSFRPAHRELKGLVKELVPHMMFLAGYVGKELEMRKLDFEVTGIKAGSDRFLITGKFRSWGDKVIAVNTPLIKEVDEYEQYDEVMALVDKIYVETDLYLKGIKRMKREDVLVDYMKDVKKREEFAVIDFDGMTPEELEELVKDFDKDLGIVVKMEDGKMVIDSSDEVEEGDGSGVATTQEFEREIKKYEKNDDSVEELPIEVDLDINEDLPM